MIKFGIMAMPQHPRTDSPVKRFRETVELTRLARDAGLDSIACGQHFLAPPYQNIQSLPCCHGWRPRVARCHSCCL